MSKSKSKTKRTTLLATVVGFVLGAALRPVGDRIAVVADRILFSPGDANIIIDIDRIDPSNGEILVTIQSTYDSEAVCRYLEISDRAKPPRFRDRLNPKKRDGGTTIDNLSAHVQERLRDGSEWRWGLLVGQTGITAVPTGSRVIPKGNSQIAFVAPGLLDYPLEVTPRHPSFGGVSIGFSLSYQFDLGGDADIKATLCKTLHRK